MTAADPAVVVDGLVKAYGSRKGVRAVDEVSFTVARGETFALLGPNGAGKTTTLEILEGFRERDAGTVRVLGLDPADNASAQRLREQIGLVLQDVAVEPYLTVRETIARNRGYYANPRGLDETIALTGLQGKEKARVNSLSGGQKRRLDLALGIVGNPSLLFLDEPTTGFDPRARREMWQVVRDLKTAGVTIILTTHYMDEAQQLADRLAVIDRGRIVAEGTADTLGGRDTAQTQVGFRRTGALARAELPVPGGTIDGDRVRLETDDPTQLLYLLTRWAIQHGAQLDGLTVERPDLEQVYLRLTADAESTAADDSAADTPPVLEGAPG